MSGAMSLVFFHTLSSGNGRSFTIIHVIVPSFDTIFFAKYGLLYAFCRITFSEAASDGISSGTICSMVIPSSVPTANSISVSDVTLSAYDRLSFSSLLSSRMSVRLRWEKMSLFFTSTAT